jgi:hypothetical protein
MTKPSLDPSAASYFRDIERRLSRLESLLTGTTVPNGSALPDAALRVNQLYILNLSPKQLHYSDGSIWHRLI